MEDNINEELQYFESIEQELVQKYLNKFIVVHNKEVVGNFDKDAEAYAFASKKYEAGTFLIRQALKEREPQVFYSRVY